MATVQEMDKFARQIVFDAFKVHDRECCTSDSPCRMRQGLNQRLVDLDNRGKSSDDFAEDDRSTTTSRSQGDGYSDNALFPDESATEPQVNLIKKLAVEKDCSQLAKLQRERVELIVSGATIPKVRATNLISKMLALPKSADNVVARPMTPNQADYIRLLADALSMDPEPHLAKLNFDLASRLIDKLKAAKSKALLAAKTADLKISEDGMYKMPGGTIVKVQFAVHGSGRLYAKKLVQDGDHWHFVKHEGLVSKLTPGMKMTLAEAVEFGRLYGICVRCGATLTDEDSIEAGIGPICRQYF